METIDMENNKMIMMTHAKSAKQNSMDRPNYISFEYAARLLLPEEKAFV